MKKSGLNSAIKNISKKRANAYVISRKSYIAIKMNIVSLLKF